MLIFYRRKGATIGCGIPVRKVDNLKMSMSLVVLDLNNIRMYMYKYTCIHVYVCRKQFV